MYTKYTKKSQVKFVEIFGILIIFIFLVVAAISFFSKIAYQQTQLDQNEKTDLGTIKTVNELSALSEIQCSIQGSTNDICIDKYKYCALQRAIEADSKILQYYIELFGAKKHIQIQAYTREGEKMPMLCQGIENAQPWTSNTLYGLFSGSRLRALQSTDQRGIPVFKPVTVYDPLTKERNFALLEVYPLQ